MYAGTKVVLSIGVMFERSDRGFAIMSLLAVAPGGVQSFFSRSADCILRITRSQISCLPPPVAESVDELESSLSTVGIKPTCGLWRFCVLAMSFPCYLKT